MRKAMRALTVLSLFGLGLGSVTSCGPSEKSISITVDGTAVENGSSVTVNQAVPFTLKATLANGSEEDQIVWRTNAASAFTFSAQVGEEITVTPNTATTTGYTISASLQGDNTVTTAINVIVTAGETKYSLDVDTSDMKTEYVQGDFFSTEGMEVYGVESINGQEINRYELGATEYTIDLINGTRLEEVGTITVHVNPVDQTYQAGSFDIAVVENKAWDFVNLMQNFADNGFAELYADTATGQVYYSALNTPDYYLELNSGMYYKAENNTVRGYQLASDKTTKETIVIDTGNVYKNYKNQTDLKDFVKTMKRSNSAVSDWSAEYSTGIQVYTSSGYEVYVLNNDASNFLASIYGYDSLAIGGVFLPVSVEATFLDPEQTVIQFSFYVSYQGQQLIAGYEFLAAIDDQIKSLVTEADAIIAAKDESNFVSYDGTYVNEFLQIALEGLGGAEKLAYSTTNDSSYIVTPTVAEARFLDSESGLFNVIGEGIIDSEHTYTDDEGEVYNLEAGAVGYQIAINPQTGSATAVNVDKESDPDVTSTSQLGRRWTDMPLLSEDYWKYYAYESCTYLSPVYDDNGENIEEYTDIYRFGIHGSDIEFTESLEALDYVYQYTLAQAGLAPYKVEVSLIVHYSPDDTKNPVDITASVMYWISEDSSGRLGYVLSAETSNDVPETFWESDILGAFDKVGETTEPAA